MPSNPASRPLAVALVALAGLAIGSAVVGGASNNDPPAPSASAAARPSGGAARGGGWDANSNEPVLADQL